MKRLIKKTAYRQLATLMLSLLVIAFGTRSTQAQIQTNQLNGGTVNTITTAVPLLLISPDARSGAMGDAGVASKPDANSAHWNPSKFAFIDDDMGFSVSYTPWLRALVPDINLAYLSGYKRIDKNQTIGLSLLYFSLGNIIFTNMVGEVTGEFNPNEFSIDGTYARKLSDHFSGGIALRYIYSNLTGGYYIESAGQSKAGQSIAADISVYYQNDVELGDKSGEYAFGLNISNIGSKMSYTETADRDFIPINLRLGGRLSVDIDEYNSISIIADVNKLLVPTPPVYELDSAGNPVQDASGNKVILYGKDPNRSVVSGMVGSFNDAPGVLNSSGERSIGKEELREITYSIGLEYWYSGQFAVRAGYFHEHATKGNRKFFTLGAGLKYNVFGIDFAYLIPTEAKHPLENTLRFTLLFDFEGLKEQNEESPPKS
ncbi:MAG TPA: type IX secretion system outer membrane channel protein PorV [Flavobacteriales bacterium]|nr:type IX secretion system outer membrane channel protein PorV [Flavobacteriales bacterium]HIA10740.1 type IX secretion system outer membrane channel protein PorV [Flavobacteriales bacterium]HIO73178.1 type IX secretion system outer membrane channel protein PorV [Flavobacteriales bacterium]